MSNNQIKDLIVIPKLIAEIDVYAHFNAAKNFTG